MEVKILYDGACPFCDDYVRYQKLRSAVDTLELLDARTHPQALVEHHVAPEALEEGMVVLVDGKPYHGAAALHLLARLSERPGRWWVRGVAWAGRSSGIARLLYPVLKLGRRVALIALGVPRFTEKSRPDPDSR